MVFFIVCFLVFLQYSGLVSTQSFNPHDDLQAYFVFPKKMLQTGAMGPDPFSARRIETSLGGQSFLHTFILSMLSEKNFNIIDPGLGIIIALSLILGCLKNKGIPKIASVFILIFFLLIPPPRTNITALVIPLVLFLSLFRTLDWEGLKTSHSMANAFVIALLTAAIWSLKSTLIPACGILFVLSYFFYIIGPKIKQKAIYEFLIATLLVGTFLLPWMISMYQSSGTLLYPLLGRGYLRSVYGPWAELTIFGVIKILLKYISYPYLVALVLLSYASIRSHPTRLAGQREASIPLSISAGLGALIVLLVTSGRGEERFLFSFIFVAIIISMIKALANIGVGDKGKIANSASLLIVIFVAGMLIGNEWYVSRVRYLDYIRNIKFGLSDFPLIPAKEVFQYTKMQQSIPQGETVLARLAKPFLLDFRRNRILIADSPRGASLPPGMPFFKGDEALADYLISKSIRYVAYSYANEAEHRKVTLRKSLGPKAHPFIRTAVQYIIDFQDNLKQLGGTRKRIYDDGEIFVLDLLSRKK